MEDSFAKVREQILASSDAMQTEIDNWKEGMLKKLDEVKDDMILQEIKKLGGRLSTLEASIKEDAQ